MNRVLTLTMVFGLSLGLQASASADFVSTFEDLGLAPNSFNNNAGGGAFVSGGNSFNNSYSSNYGGTWSGFSVSSKTDTTTAGYTNQYSAITGSGANGSATYGVGFTFGGNVDPFHPDGSYVNLVSGTNPASMQVTNTTYDYLSMKNGDSFSKKFGAGDYFLLRISGFSATGGVGAKVGEVDFYLANFLNGNSLIVNTWQNVDLTTLAGAKSLRFGLESTDNNVNFGLNTPAYFAIDNLTVRPAAVPEPSAWLICLVGAGVGGWGVRRRAA